MFAPFDVDHLTAFHDAHHARPGRRRPPPGDPRLWQAIEANHLCNSLLWEQEDRARRRDVPPGEIVRCKRLIDASNQRRNDAVESIDELLLAALADLGPPAPSARLSSETAGAMIDRLSIQSLKIHHMGLQALRSDSDAEHLARCRARLVRLREQRSDLAACLARLLREAMQGTAYFKVYRQFKMYNDPSLNPWLYRRGGMPAELRAPG
jgi:hypothetical protein